MNESISKERCCSIRHQNVGVSETYHVLFQDQQFVYNVLDVGANGSICQESVSLKHNSTARLNYKTLHCIIFSKFDVKGFLNKAYFNSRRKESASILVATLATKVAYRSCFTRITAIKNLLSKNIIRLNVIRVQKQERILFLQKQTTSRIYNIPHCRNKLPGLHSVFLQILCPCVGSEDSLLVFQFVKSWAGIQTLSFWVQTLWLWLNFPLQVRLKNDKIIIQLGSSK